MGENPQVPADPSLARNPDFLIPYLAETQSIAGDQFGRVALSILVFDRTSSVAWTALTYALTYLPAILGGFVLGGIGDRFPRIWVMVSADAARAGLFLCVAVPGVPLPVVVSLVAAAFFLGPAFTAALVSRLAAVLTPDRFRAASGVRMITSQTAQVAGFAIGGVVVTVIGPRAALIINAATFGLSALIVAVTLGSRTKLREPAHQHPADAELTASDAPLAAEVMKNPFLRHLIAMTVLAGFFVVPEGLAVPVAHALHHGSSISGLLLASGPLGSAVGAALLVKFIPRRKGMTAARLMSIACGVPLMVTALLPPWPVLMLCWAISGGLWAYQVDVATALVHAVGDEARSKVIARASALLLGAQGVGLIVFGGIGAVVGPDWGVALAGLAGVVCASAVALSGHRRGFGGHGNAARHRARPHSLPF